MTKRKLVQLVNAQFGKVGHKIQFDVVAAGVCQEESWWYVPVLATRNGKDIPREFAVNIFANVEDDLEQNQHVSVLFIPGISDPIRTRSRVRNGQKKSSRTKRGHH